MSSQDGVHSGTTRLSLKTQRGALRCVSALGLRCFTRLERFGDIDICHKIGDPREAGGEQKG